MTAITDAIAEVRALAERHAIMFEPAWMRRYRTLAPLLADECERLAAALQKVSDIRDSIVGKQGFNFSEHAYPLVAVLDEAGFPGAGYEIARKNLGTLIEQRDSALADRDRLQAVLNDLTEFFNVHRTAQREDADPETAARYIKQSAASEARKRDRLAAENAALRAELAQEVEEKPLAEEFGERRGSESRRRVGACRRCTECVGHDHHWLYGAVNFDEAPLDGAEYGCKHCDAVGVRCATCGADPELDDEAPDPECPKCGGVGIALLKGGG